MKKVLLGSIAVAALVVAMADSTRRAAAQSTDTQRIEAIEKENATMRMRLKRIEAETENAALRARLDRLDPQGRSTPRRLPSGSESVMISPRDPALQDYAADMELKAPHRGMPNWYSWTGLYVGGNAGYGIGNNRETQTISELPAILSSFDDSVVAPKGIIGGAQIGYNWQGGSNWLAGFEADFQGSSQKDAACGPTCAVQTAPVFGTTNTSTIINQELLYFGTFRGRVGFVNKDALFYLTGGGAWGRVRESVTFSSTSAGGTPPITPSTIASNQVSSDQFGWVVGGGIEGALSGNWTAKAEYLYMDLGRMSSSFGGAIFTSSTTTAPFTIGTTSAIRDHIVRVGLNYRLVGGMAGSSAMAYARDGMQDYAADRGLAPRMLSDSMYSWTGLYFGVNVGYSSGNDRTAATWDEGGSTIFHIVPAGDSVTAPSGVIGGAQIGYNWQGGANWLVGFEADFQGSNQKDTACASPICLNASQQGIVEELTIEQELSYFATFRGRAGVVRNGVLLYVTGGGAWARVNETDNFTVNPGPGSGAAPTIVSSQTSQNKVGWVAGGGIEGALWGNWTAKVEYLFMDLGAISNAFNFALNVSGGGTNPFTVATTSTIRDHIFRVGLNYRFDGGAAPIAARY
jgi:outer membrane immunogenic protein